MQRLILVDTSVWIDYFKGRISPQTNLLDESIKQGKVVMGDLILLEILQGIRDDRQYDLVKKRLTLLDTYAMLSPDMAVICSENYRELRKKGITIRKTNDVIIASFCIEKNFSLLYCDRDFKPFTQFSGFSSAYQES